MEEKSDAYCHAREKHKKVTNARCDLFNSAMVSKKMLNLSEVPFRSSVIVRLFHRGSFIGQWWLTISRFH